jgi:hypothetical protein
MEMLVTPSSTMAPTMKNQYRIASDAASYTPFIPSPLRGIVSYFTPK